MNRLTRWFQGWVAKTTLSSVVGSRGGWIPLVVRDWFTGAWQQNRALTADTVLAHHAVYTCITLIASDIGKLRPKLVQRNTDGIWTEASSAQFSPILRKPNHFQNHIQFKEWWIVSKLTRGNTYVLKQRDRDGTVVALYLLDPSRVQVLVADDGSVFYQLGDDKLSKVTETVTVPASEIIHDRMNCLFHPLIGVSPIFAAGMAASIGLKIETSSSGFHGNGSNPSGILTAPGTITKETAELLRDSWQKGFSGENSGRIAVVGDGLKFQPLQMTAADAQLIEHLHWSAETVCSTFHVPAFKAGIGQMPTYQNAEILNQIYYSDCLQSHIESMEAGLDDGLDLMRVGTLGVELDLDGLLRMDTATQVKTLSEGIGGALLTPNEARRRMDLLPLDGGDTVYMQQQNYSLAALDERDRNKPFAMPAPGAPALPPAADGGADDDGEERAIDIRRRGHRLLRTAA